MPYRSTRIVIVCIASVIFSCRKPLQDTPPGILDAEKMVSVLVDIHYAEATANVNALRPDSAVKFLEAAYRDVFFSHHTSRAQFEKSYDYYQQNPKELDRIYEEVLKKIPEQ